MPGGMDGPLLPQLPELLAAGVQFGQQGGQRRVAGIPVRRPAQPGHRDPPELLGAGAEVALPPAEEAAPGQVALPAEVLPDQRAGQGVAGDDVVGGVGDDRARVRQPAQHVGHVRAHPPHRAGARRRARSREPEQVAALGRGQPQCPGQSVQDAR